MTVKAESGDRIEIWVRNVVWLCCCVVNVDTKGAELGLIQYMTCVLPLHAMDETLRCVCLRCVTTNSGKDEDEVGTALEENNYTIAEKFFEQFFLEYSEHCSCSLG